MARRRRIPRLIANPLTTVVVAAALLADLSYLPGDPRAADYSSAGGLYHSLVTYAPRQPIALGPRAIILKDTRGLHLRNMSTEPSWGDVATIMSDKPADAALFGGPDDVGRGRGLWAITTRSRDLEIDARFGSAFNAFDKQGARELYINEMVMPEWAESPRLLERLRREDFTLTEVVWSGYAHNALALAGFVLLMVSLAWVPRTPGFVRGWRGARRQKRGLCPWCAYPIRGLAVCPECGSGVMRQVSGADAGGA